MKTIRNIVFFSILCLPIRTFTIEATLPLNKQISQRKEGVLETENTIKQIIDDKATKIGADILTSIAHLCFLYCIIKAIYPHEQEAYKGTIHAQ